MKFDPSLYLVLDPGFTRKRSVQDVLREAVEGGVTLVQIREKNCSQQEFLDLAIQVAPLLKAYGIPLIINDRLDVAVRVGAEGVHLGQSDIHWSEARRLLGPQAIIGLSVESEAQEAEAEGAAVDYLGVSSLFPTETKKDIRKVWGLEGLKTLRRSSSHRLVGIGGIDLENAASALHAGADGLALVSAITSASSIRLSTQSFQQIIRGVREST